MELKENSIFVDTIRKYQEGGDEEPYRKAIEECIEKNVLADYLRKKWGIAERFIWKALIIYKKKDIIIS